MRRLDLAEASDISSVCLLSHGFSQMPFSLMSLDIRPKYVCVSVYECRPRFKMAAVYIIKSEETFFYHTGRHTMIILWNVYERRSDCNITRVTRNSILVMNKHLANYHLN